MANPLQGITTKGFLTFLIAAIAVFALVSNFINYSAIGKEPECVGTQTTCAAITSEDSCVAATGCTWTSPEILKSDLDVTKISNQGIQWFMIIGVAMLVLRFGFWEGKWGRKEIIAVVIVAVILYFGYDRFLQPMLSNLLPGLNLPKLSQSAIQLQAIATP